jgi:hypothetical protein
MVAGRSNWPFGWRPLRLLAIVALLSAYVWSAATSAAQESIAFDELGHLTGGVSAWVTRDFRLFPQNGLLPQRWAAAPLVLAGVRFPPITQPAWEKSDLEAIGYQFLYGVGNDHDALLWHARLMMLPVGVLLSGICYAWAKRLFGVTAGLVALAACSFSPAVLAHGHLATSDVFAALMFTASLALLWQTLHRLSAVRLLASAVVMGLLFVTKMSAVLMAPIAIVLAGLRIWHSRPLVWLGRKRLVLTSRHQLLTGSAAILAVHAAGVLLVIWASYDFRYATQRQPSPHAEQFLGETIDTISYGQALRPLIRLARDERLLPEAYLFGLAHVFNRADKFVGFLNGRYSVHGWGSFFAWCWLMKTPIALFVLLGLAGAAAWRAARTMRPRARVRAGYRLAPLVVLLAVYWTAASLSGLNLGERHVLPAYPAMFILAGGAAWWAGSRPLGGRAAVSLALVLLSVESIGAWPHYLSYFNTLAGGPAAGYRHLVDSSLDWGQDLPGLARWLQRTRETGSSAPVFLSYFGSGSPAHYGIDARQIFSYQDWRTERPLQVLTGGIYCVSATMLQSIYTRTPGPWAEPYERAYRQTKMDADRFVAAMGGPLQMDHLSSADAATWHRLVRDYDELRFGRLAAYLRQRTPDDSIGYSILIFTLTDRDVQEALDGPPAELWPNTRVDGW